MSNDRSHAGLRRVRGGVRRWGALRGAQGRRCPRSVRSGATGVKNPDYSDTLYVTQVMAPNTVNTMPEKTVDAVADPGVITDDTVTGTAEAAQVIFDKLETIGID